MDPRSRKEFIRFLSKLHSEGDLAIITATHDVDIVPLIADRAYVLSDGKFIGAGTVAEIFSNETVLEKASLAPPLLTQLFHKTRSINQQMAHDPLPMTLTEAKSLFRKYCTAQPPS
jgi:cobalt/nickel transport system ATP-binding protein